MIKTKEMKSLEKQIMENSRKGDLYRGRSVSVGTSFGGTTEISIRLNDGHSAWVALQPGEVVELVHQLASNIGCHIHVQPRKDFSSWRDWKDTPNEKVYLNGYPSFVNMCATVPAHEQQPGLQPALMAKETQDEQTVAIEKTL